MKLTKAALSLLLAFTLCVTPALAGEEETESARNTAPVAENQELETYRGVSVGGQLSAYDAEGGNLTYAITTEPMKGCVELSPDGSFVYTPKENKRGKDYFGFRATDEDGNVSQEGTVIIRLLKQKTKITYSDMTENAAEYPAIALTEKGVFTGEYVGSDYVFHPDSTVSRGEFLTMCMTAADCNLLKGVSSTGFQDDAEIGVWLKPYVSTALLSGYISGTATETGAIFRPAEDITLREACSMLNAVLSVTDVVSVAAYIDEPEMDGAQAVANLTACNVMLPRWESLDASLTRGEAAQLLQNAMNLLENR